MDNIRSSVGSCIVLNALWIIGEDIAVSKNGTKNPAKNYGKQNLQGEIYTTSIHDFIKIRIIKTLRQVVL